MWLIELLTTDAMSNPKRSAGHWKEIFTECECKDLELNDELTLGKLIAANFIAHRAVIEDISKKAEK